MSIKQCVGVTVIFFFFISLFSGCTLLGSTEVRIVSQSIYDDAGFPSLSVRFNTTGKITLKLTGPLGSLFQEEFFSGVHDAVLHLDAYWKTPRGGVYTLRALDRNNNLVFENQMTFTGPDLSIAEVEYFWWDSEQGTDLVGVEVLVVNNGDLPAYPFRVVVDVASEIGSGVVIPRVVLPLEGERIAACLNIAAISKNMVDTVVTLQDLDESEIGRITEQVAVVDSVDELTFSWRYLGARSIQIPELPFLYFYYRDRERFLSDDYAVYVFDQADDAYIEVLAKVLSEDMGTMDTIDTVNYIASFTQDITYASDDDLDPSCEYPKFPVETLVDGRGDCEDKAILTVSLLAYLGYEVALLRLPNHMAVGVHLPSDATGFDYFLDEYYFLETTRNRWVVGKVPDEYVGVTNATAYPITSRPVLLHTWRDATRFTTSDGEDYIRMRIRVENIGSGPIQNFVVQGEFMTVDNMSRNPRNVVVYGLEPGLQVEVGLEMDVPVGVTTVLKTQVVVDGRVVQEKESTSTFP
ncbi:MAG: hypothetical protein KKC68_00665 [Candidatus Thermoplasmatota archaeon]|nr:hypothetical protein [Candidatus Thermoplasmatota archaeon]MBU1940263.1 hypothetical protein [Candidatus Thermoplasmatota archaeon]